MNNGYLASPNIITSTANLQLIPNSPAGWTQGYKLAEFQFVNIDLPCQVLINDVTTVFLLTGQGWGMKNGMKPIESFKVITSGVKVVWSGVY